MAIITGYGDVVQETPGYQNAAVTLAVQKAQNPRWHHIFLRGIRANWAICFAVSISISAGEVASKGIAFWWPTATFITPALDHVIAICTFPAA